jgi:hypothetical protein
MEINKDERTITLTDSDIKIETESEWYSGYKLVDKGILTMEQFNRYKIISHVNQEGKRTLIKDKYNKRFIITE